MPSSRPSAPRVHAELLPARMCNEFVYCPRLFHLEHVQGIFVESADTVEGSAQHTRAEKRGLKRKRRASEPEDTEEASPPWTLPRTLELIAPKLGVTGKLDLVEVETDHVTVVEAKRGRAPKTQTHTWGDHELDYGIWPADVAQVGLYVAMLREHGFPCTQARIYYRSSNTTRELAWSDTLELFLHAVVARARECGQNPAAPLPLVDSPKCVGCSLHGGCLPDEHNALLREQRAAHPIRRILPARDDLAVMHVTTAGTVVRKRGESLVACRRDGAEQKVLLKDISHLALFGRASVTEPCLVHLLRHGIQISHHTAAGRLMGMTHTLSTVNIHLRRAQYRAADDPSLQMEAARGWVLAKIHNQRTVLRRYRKGAEAASLDELGSLPDWANAAPPNREPAGPSVIADSLRSMKVAAGAARRAQNIDALRGHEGDAAARYFAALPPILPTAWQADFAGRTRRPPRDRVNAMLSFGYALLVRDATAALARIGLDPMLGLFHTVVPGRPALALDLLEPYRPAWVDAAILRLVATGGIERTAFQISTAGVTLSKAGRARVIRAYERRADELTTHPSFGYRLSLRRMLELDARLLGKWLCGEVPNYTPFRTR